MTRAEWPVPPGANSALHTLYRMWAGLKREDSLPSCADIDAETYVSQNPGAALLQVDRRGGRRLYRYRMVGSHHRSAMGREVVGFTLDDMVPPRILPVITGTYDRIVQERVAHYWTRTLGLASGSAHAYERLLVPLADDGENVDALLGIWKWHDEITPADSSDPVTQGYSV